MEADIAALGEPDHIGILVKDVDKAVKFLSAIGFGPWQWIDFVQEDDVVMANGRTRQKIAFANIGKTVMEVIEPIEGGGYWPDFIAATNGGVIHCTNSIWINLAFINTWLFFGASGSRKNYHSKNQNYPHLYLFTS